MYYDGGFTAGLIVLLRSTPFNSMLTPVADTAGLKQYADSAQVQFQGRIAFLKQFTNEEDNSQFLAVKMIHNVNSLVSISLTFTNNNGLNTAYSNGNLVVGQELRVYGRINGIRTTYMDDNGQLQVLKRPELQLLVKDYEFGRKPAAKAEATAAQPTLEEIPF
jgi:hypothetical protein